MKMKKIQISIAQLDNYGPWTVSPEPKPEAYLQILQTRLFADLEEEFSERGGLAFITRFDNTLAVSNGLSKEDHIEIQRRIRENYPVTVSFGVASAENSYEAQKHASKALQDTGSSQSEDRSEELSGKTLKFPEESLVQIAHIDIDSVTSYTDAEPIYDTHHLIQKVHLSLSESLSSLDGLVFYTGGDNFMAPSNGLDLDDILEVLEEVEKDTGIRLKAGVGRSSSPVEAAHLASEGLHAVREDESSERVVLEND